MKPQPGGLSGGGTRYQAWLGGDLGFTEEMFAYTYGSVLPTAVTEADSVVISDSGLEE